MRHAGLQLGEACFVITLDGEHRCAHIGINRQDLRRLIPGNVRTAYPPLLMEIQASRLNARVAGNGEPILLMQQNRALWDRTLIHRGLLALARGEALGQRRGPYLLQAAIAACHARAATAAETDWVLITALYDDLARLSPSPVVELNRAVAVSMAYGPAAGLELTDRLAAQGTLRTYHLLPSVRGDLLVKLGRYQEARGEFERAATLTQNRRESRLLLDRAAACGAGI